jgi:hypothetical protein
MVEQSAVDKGRSQSGVGCLVRFLWMAVGNGVLGILLVFIAQRKGFVLGFIDALFALTVLVLIGLRWLDVSRLNGQTVEAEPATLAHWRRYALGLAGVALMCWLAAKLVSGLGWLG